MSLTIQQENISYLQFAYIISASIRKLLFYLSYFFAEPSPTVNPCPQSWRTIRFTASSCRSWRNLQSRHIFCWCGSTSSSRETWDNDLAARTPCRCRVKRPTRICRSCCSRRCTVHWRTTSSRPARAQAYSISAWPTQPRRRFRMSILALIRVWNIRSTQNRSSRRWLSAPMTQVHNTWSWSSSGTRRPSAISYRTTATKSRSTPVWNNWKPIPSWAARWLWRNASISTRERRYWVRKTRGTVLTATRSKRSWRNWASGHCPTY